MIYWLTTLSDHLYQWLTLMSHSCCATILWVMPVYTSWPLPPLHPCHSPGPGQGWVCDDLHSRTSWFKDSHSSHPYLNLSVSSECMHKKFDSWATPPVFPHLLGSCPCDRITILASSQHHDPCLLSTFISLPPFRYEGCLQMMMMMTFICSFRNKNCISFPST
jgi:hypothetical protein